MIERIVTSALHDPTTEVTYSRTLPVEMEFELERPCRHHHIINALNDPALVSRCIQGFVTSTGRFVDRKRAIDVARESGQLRSGGPRVFELTSEDLW